MAIIHASLSLKERSLSSVTAAIDMDTLPESAAMHDDAGSAPRLSTRKKNARKRRTRADIAVQHAEDHTLRGPRSVQSARSRSRSPRLFISRDRRDSHCPHMNPLSQQPKTGRQYSRGSVEQPAAALEALAEPAAEPTKRQTTWTSKHRSQH